MISLRWSSVSAFAVVALVACGGRVDGGSSGSSGGDNGTNGNSGSNSTNGSGTSGSSGGSTSTTNSSCNGSLFSICSGGVVSTSCCPADAPCAAAQSYCTNSDGSCFIGTDCDADGGSSADSGACASIDATDYNQACTTDSDCVAVYAGSVCSECYCPNAAINQNAQTAYQHDFVADGAGNGICACPESPPPSCVAGACVILAP